MTGVPPPAARCPERLEMLTFRRRGVPMAADVEQLQEITPEILVLRGQGKMRTVEIDGPRDMVTVPVGSIQPMPALVAACAAARPYWGAVILDGSPVLLVDLDELTTS